MELLIFIFFVFGIIGIQLFSGLLRQRCYSTVPPYEMFPPHPEARTRLRDGNLGRARGINSCRLLVRPLRSKCVHAEWARAPACTATASSARIPRAGRRISTACRTITPMI
jgi:hypothetical protein